MILIKNDFSTKNKGEMEDFIPKFKNPSYYYNLIFLIPAVKNMAAKRRRTIVLVMIDSRVPVVIISGKPRIAQVCGKSSTILCIKLTNKKRAPLKEPSSDYTMVAATSEKNS